MYIKYKTTGCAKSIFFACITIIVLLLVQGKTNAQVSPVNVNINVMPPYSSAVYDYINNPNKVIISLTHAQLDYPDIELYLKATITGENGIKIATEDGYKPSQPILLQRGKTYRLNSANISDAFSENHLNTIGITVDELINGAGLPEGSYQICVQAFDFKTDRPLSAEEPLGCSNTFTITNLEPPMIVMPQCGDNYANSPVQMVNIAWTIPAGALSALSYKLEMVEIPENSQIDPREAFENSKYPFFYEESTRLNQIILTTQKVTLTAGYTYAFRIKAEDPLGRMNFRNNGYSEVCWFTYNKSEKPEEANVTLNDSVDFVFFNPKQTNTGKADTLEVNSENNLLLNWGWIKKTVTGTELADQKIIQDNDLQKYILTIEQVNKFKTQKSSFQFRREFQKVDSTGLINNFLQLTFTEAIDAGFEDGKTYQATIQSYNKANQPVKTADSPEFIFRKIKDDMPLFKIPIQAVINYGFENYPDIFPVNNSEIIIEALATQRTKRTNNQVINSSFKLLSGLPSENIKNNSYAKIASIVAKTDSQGKLDTLIAVPQQYFDTDSVAFRIRLANNYYVDKDFGAAYLTQAKAKKNTGVNFGSLTAKTYAYTLKVNVRKEFTSYTLEKDANGLTVSLAGNKTSSQFSGSTKGLDDEKQSYTDNVGRDTIAENIPVVLYRLNKKENVPSYEGDIDKSNPAAKNVFSDITVVAFGTTQLEKDSTFVTFNKLLATNNPQDEYCILAIKDLNSFLSPAYQKKSENNFTSNKQSTLSKNYTGKLDPNLISLLADAIKNFNQNGTQTNFVDSGKFVATVMPYYLKLPVNTNDKDAYYRTAKANYTITSCTPPTSRIKGKLLYEWKSDVNMVKRPLSNTHFRVVVDYVDEKGRSIGIVKNSGNGALANIIGGSWEYTSFEPDNSNNAIPLVDQYATMAEGMTDNDGNFTIDAVNINKKGDLGAGTVNSSSGSSKPPVTGQSEEDKLKQILGGGDVINPIESSLGQFGVNQGSSWSNQSKGIQSSLNGGVFNVGFNSGTMSYELSSVKNTGKQAYGMANTIKAPDIANVAHGPNAPEPQSATDTKETSGVHYSQFRRTFRIVIDGDNADYYYPSNKVIEIQPFENTLTPVTLTHYVREFKLLVKTTETNQKKDTIALSQVQVTLFRDTKNKSKHLPLGEGDGKYTYKELVSPEYDNYSKNSPKTAYEQLWTSQPVEQIGNNFGKQLGSLIQSENDKYLIQASSYVNTGNKAYQATIVPLGGIIDQTDDWDAPNIPVLKCTVVLKPLLSRALVLVRDSLSGQILAKTRNTKVILSKSSFYPWLLNNQNSVATDQYGYAEFIAGQAPLTSDFLNKPVYFAARADGFTFGNQPLYKTENFYPTGYQSTPRLTLLPTATSKGRIVNADAFSYYGPGSPNQSQNQPPYVKAYIQADSSKVFETDDSGNFEMPIAPKAGVKIKIIPKDVAWFDTTYVLTAADEKKSLINLNDIKLYRRKHRIQFNITQKMPNGFTGPATPVNGATIQLGENTMATASNGTAKFVFENVSVNNYTFIIRGPKGGGYIPKTVPLKSNESKDFHVETVVLEKGSEVTGTVTLDNKPVKNARVYIEVNNTSASPQNYTPITQSYSANSTQTLGNQTAKTVTGVANQNLLNTNLNLGLQPTGSITDDANLVVARTDAQGKYKLQGVPVNNQKINIIATIDTTFTVSGDKQQVNIVNGKGQLNLNMTSFGDMIVNKLYGFPLTVEKITPVGQNQIKVTGLVNWTEAISDFMLKDNNKALRVEDVLFDVIKTGNDPANAVVHDNSVKIPGITSLKLSYINKYNVKLTAFGQNQLYNSTPLQFIKENDLGKLSGRMQIVDNSFNYPSSYLDFKGSDFYLTHLNNDSTLNHQISVATSAFTQTESMKKNYREPENFRKEIDNKVTLYRQQPLPVYHLCNQAGDPLKFKLINFTASANPKKSYISSDGKIHLNTTLTCHIDHAKPEDFSVNIPDMILDENKVYPAASAKPINVKLEDWNLEARNWSFSTTEGGLLSNKAKIRTKIIDIPVGKFVLRADKFIMEDYKLDSLTMGGGKFPLLNIQKGAAHLNYEYKVGNDMGAHWNFCLVGTGNTAVASLPPLAGLPGYNIDLNYIEILSNNEMVVQLMQKGIKPNLFGNPVAQFEPLSIFNGPNYIGVSGLLNTHAPRMSELNLTANWSSRTENPKFENVITDFEGKGFVHFMSEKQKIDIDENQVVIEGSVAEKPDLTFNPMPAKFYARKAGTPKYEVAIDKDWTTLLSEAENSGTPKTHTPQNSTLGYRLKIDKGGMTADDKDWSTLSYEGPMTKNSTGSEDITPTKVKFEVLGDVSAKSDGLSVTGISTPFGSMSQVYDFKKKQLTGTLSIDEAITLGAVRINSGVIETCFGVPGFYVAGGCNSFINASLLTGTYNLGFMAGNYTNSEGINRAWDVTNNYIDQRVVNKCYKSNTLDQQKLHGVYIAVNRELLNVDLSWDFILASGYIRALALIGGDFYANFSKTSTLGVDGYVYIDAGAGLSCITGTSINGGILGRANFGAQLEASPSFKMTVNGSLDLGFNASISQSLLFTTISKDITIGCCLEASVDTQKNTNFDFHKGGCSDSGCNEKSPK